MHHYSVPSNYTNHLTALQHAYFTTLPCTSLPFTTLHLLHMSTLRFVHITLRYPQVYHLPLPSPAYILLTLVLSLYALP